MTPAERVAAEALAARGHSPTTIGQLLDRQPKTIAKYLREAREVLQASLPDYARIHRRAAEAAADKGDARPAEWALERAGVVEPAKTGPAGPAWQVKIGIMLPGLPPLAVSAGSSDSAEPDRAESLDNQAPIDAELIG